MRLAELREKMLAGLEPGAMRRAIESLAVNPKRPLGKMNPWCWWVELVRGCNLSCVFCATRLFKRGEYHFMDLETWRSLILLVNETTPYGRIGFADAGEPTLHPHFCDLMREARRLAPQVQIMTYTNGTRLVSGELTYREMFESGINCVFTDMYASYETHRALAEASGYEWYHEDEKPDSIKNVFEYDGPHRHTIRLSENPYSWSKRKMGRGEFHTFLNDLDWSAAKLFGITPVESAPRRRCDQPSKFVSVNHDGTYAFCCVDFMRHTAGKIGAVSEGLGGFFEFWLGRYMQDVRLKVGNKDRAAHELCSRCSFVSIRSDIPYWRSGVEQFWDGSGWQQVPPYSLGSDAAGELKHMRRTPSSKERAEARSDPQRKLFDVGVKELR
jgi:hypothetical protein